MVMKRVCRDEVVARAVEKLWKRRFCHCFCLPPALICVAS